MSVALRFYLVPLVGTDGSRLDPPRPKYIAQGGVAAGYTAITYGRHPVLLVACHPTATEHGAIVANADAAAFPADLTQLVGANLATVQSTLESFTIPADWVTSGLTYKIVLRWISRLCMFCERYGGLSAGGDLLTGVTLESTVGDLSVAVRQTLQAVADAFGITTQGITLTTTIRAAFKILADQLPGFDMVDAT